MWTIDNNSPHMVWNVYGDEVNGLIGKCVQKDNGSYYMVFYDYSEEKLLPGGCIKCF